MKRKGPVHAKLYVDVIIKHDNIECFYKQNKFDNNGNRVLEKEVKNDDFEFNQKNEYLIKKNMNEFQILNNYLKIQKMVLEKHEKARNYDAYNIVKNSINLICEFKNEFDSWFKEYRK